MIERLAALMIENDGLLRELEIGRGKINAAREALPAPGRSPLFCVAHLDRCRRRHQAVLTRLRANRIEALQLMGDTM